jgi:hypothetical protein
MQNTKALATPDIILGRCDIAPEISIVQCPGNCLLDAFYPVSVVPALNKASVWCAD